MKIVDDRASAKELRGNELQKGCVYTNPDSSLIILYCDLGHAVVLASRAPYSWHPGFTFEPSISAIWTELETELHILK